MSITVWDHPELTLPAGEQRSQVESGSPVNAAGEIFYPYIGNVRVAGRDTAAIQQELSGRLSKYVPDPQIEVKVAAFNSQKVIITGEVARPGSVGVSNIPLNLVEALTASGGVLSGADSRQVRIRRDGQTHYIDLDAFLRSGNGVNNPILHGGDIVNVPARSNNVAYILGKILEPGSVDLGSDGLNLTDALTQRGGLDEEIANAQGIFVFRAAANNRGFDVFQLDATTPLAFVIATKFALHPQDVVYVVADPVARWNAIVAGLLPSISAIRGVQIVAGVN